MIIKKGRGWGALKLHFPHYKKVKVHFSSLGLCPSSHTHSIAESVHPFDPLSCRLLMSGPIKSDQERVRLSGP